ncbi:MAG: TetR/AcrR family transcriptional regulator [Bacteroidota bacterium]
MPREKQFDEQEVLKKAMLLFWRKGYHDTSIKDLIAFLGISNASIYNAFGGKKKLFDRAFSNYRMTNLHALNDFLSAQKNIKRGLQAIFHRIIEDDCNDPDCKGCFIVNSIAELIPGDPEFKIVTSQHQKSIEEVFVTHLKLGVRRGQIPDGKNLEVISTALYTHMTGLRVVGKTTPNAEEMKASTDAVLSALLS